MWLSLATPHPPCHYKNYVTDIPLQKLEGLGSPLQGKHHAIQEGGRVLLRLTDIRDARKVHDNVQLGNPEWRATSIAPVDFFHVSLVCTRISGLSWLTYPNSLPIRVHPLTLSLKDSSWSSLFRGRVLPFPIPRLRWRQSSTTSSRVRASCLLSSV